MDPGPTQGERATKPKNPRNKPKRGGGERTTTSRGARPPSPPVLYTGVAILEEPGRQPRNPPPANRRAPGSIASQQPLPRSERPATDQLIEKISRFSARRRGQPSQPAAGSSQSVIDRHPLPPPPPHQQQQQQQQQQPPAKSQTGKSKGKGKATTTARLAQDEPAPAPPTTTTAAAVPPNQPDQAKSKPKRKKPKRSRAEKLKAQEAHLQLVLDAAQTVAGILEPRGLSCAVFGSLASKLYGCPRMPKDVDMLITPLPSYTGTEPTAMELKDMLLLASPRNFYLRLPRDPTAPYRILYFRRNFRSAECKVDILIPGVMGLPWLESGRVLRKIYSAPVEGQTGMSHSSRISIPVVPFSLLLFQKLQGWSDHVDAEEEFKRKKQVQDAADVKKLLSLSKEIKTLSNSLASKEPEEPSDDELPAILRDTGLFTPEFAQASLDRVKRFVRAFGDPNNVWRSLGFEFEEGEIRVGLASVATTKVADTKGKTVANGEESESETDEDLEALQTDEEGTGARRTDGTTRHAAGTDVDDGFVPGMTVLSLGTYVVDPAPAAG
ncbi:hypothetical protein D9613_004481 [Agrocybe pediades]|uniref:Uncharacterized protein n=1 Tax=Agrocybe pediades TaxID=84607 RepID=A0A8H4QJI5_9AGAR|nr:hypothetical protein D9613_004481 [Agrocybe pediades]